MDLMEQCQRWNENEEYQRIIDAIERLPSKERTPELESELACAYNNIASAEDREFYERAIELLKPHEEYFEGDHNWNFSIAYAFYYLDQEGMALHYFKRALEARPGDEDTEEFIADCRRRLSLPRFERSFRERVAAGWASFEQGEGELRRLLDSTDRTAVTEKLIAQCTELLSPAFAEINFELGFNGEKYELILSPEGNRAKLFELVYFQHRVPKALLEHWNILVGRQPSQGLGLCVSGQEISAEDVQVWVERQDETPEDTKVALTLFCEKLLPLFHEDEGRAWWMLSILTDQVLGEIPVMSLVEGFQVVGTPKPERGILLAELPQALETMGLHLDPDPERFLENGYIAYKMKPVEDSNAGWRLDVVAGNTRCPALVNEYLSGTDDTMNAFHQDGAVPGFICYPINAFADEPDVSGAALDFRDKLETALLREAGADAVTILGGASGIYFGYLDFIAWDLTRVLDVAAEFFQDSFIAWAAFHTFRRETSTVGLKREPSEDGETAGPQGTDGGQEGEGKGAFVGFVLLSDASWDREELIRHLKADWDLDAGGDEDDGNDESAGVLIFSVGGTMAAVSLVPAPVPGQEAEKNAANNYMWPSAVEIAKAHKAHLMVAVLGKDTPLLERGKLFTKVVASCCKQETAMGVYTSGTVFEPRFYEEFAAIMKEGGLPIFNWIWFGLYQSETGVCCYTYGMKIFGKDEMEVVNADGEPSEVRDFLSDMVSYVLENDVTLHDGETIGFSEDQKLPITRSEGVSLPEMTLKIGYGPIPEEEMDG